MKVSFLISQLSQNEVAQFRLMHDEGLRQQQSASGQVLIKDEHGKRYELNQRTNLCHYRVTILTRKNMSREDNISGHKGNLIG